MRTRRADVKRTAAPYSRAMALAEHLERPHRRGELIAGSHTGAAGGAACGDLLRVSVAVERDRVRCAAFDARGCAVALHRALGAAARADASLERSPGRVLVAMSGGVDSAVAALLCGQRAVAVTLELSDPGTDGDGSCCSPQAVRGARALAHELGLP